MPTDIAQDIYRYLARDWGLQTDSLTPAKYAQLGREIPELRKDYYGNRAVAYYKPLVRRAYLAAFAPRYAYTLYECLNRVKAQALQVLNPWHKKEGVIALLGGGPACEVFGLVDWLYENNIQPRFLRVIILDREGYWRSFHNFMFSELLNARFRKTMVIPSYESVDFPVPTGKKFDRTSMSYNFAQTSLLAEARVLSLINCLSELADHRGIEYHLRFLTRIACEPQLIVSADSAAKKRRPRVNWLKGFFDNARNFQSSELFDGMLEMPGAWLSMDQVTQQIFRTNAPPKWEQTMKRWVHIRRTD